MGILNPLEDAEFIVLVIIFIISTAFLIFGGIGLYELWRRNTNVRESLENIYNQIKEGLFKILSIVENIKSAIQNIIIKVEECKKKF